MNQCKSHAATITAAVLAILFLGAAATIPAVGGNASLIMATNTVKIVPQAGASKTLEEKVDEIVENTTMDQNGIVQPETGGAEPTENWFGCKPGAEGDEACEAEKPITN